MLDKFEGVDAAYSIGINDDVSWDLDIVERNIPVFQYDHTIPDTPLCHELMCWRQIGLGATADPGAKINTLAGMLRENGHSTNHNLILKCDIEGHEWETFSNMPVDVLDQFSQIAMEVHAFEYLDDDYVARNVRSSIEKLTDSHYMVHVHANNYSSWNINTGVPLPNVLEMTFARKDLGQFEPSGEIFPTDLDMPCDPKRPDYYLGSFTFPSPGASRLQASSPVDRNFIANSYELFLGRDLETDDVVRDRNGWPVRNLLNSILSSTEFTSNVLLAVQQGRPFPAHLFQGRPTRRMKFWAADHLPVAPSTRESVARAEDWRELLQVLLSEPELMRQAGVTPLHRVAR